MGQSADNLRPKTTVYDHVRELQMRLLASVISLALASFLVYLFYEPILALLSSPLNAPLYYSSPAGGFAFVMKICLTGSLIITVPILTYNLIMFVRPAIGSKLSVKRVLLTTASSTFLAFAGAAFAFYVILPGTLVFFKGFQVKGLNALISADNYLGFVTNIIIMFVIVFQIPLLMSFVDRIKPLQPSKLLKMEKWVVIGSLTIALLAPFTYDLLTSLLIALPIIALYNLSIIFIVIRHARSARKVRSAIYATISKPSYANTESALSLSDMLFEDLSVELSEIEKTKPMSTIPSGHSVMDIRKTNTKPENIKPAAWVQERKNRIATINSQRRVFSDIKRSPRINHVLASQ